MLVINVKGDSGILNTYHELLLNLEKVHTTEMGVTRIKRNLSLDTDDVVAWCKSMIELNNDNINRAGKNWYVDVGECIITINSYNFTIITAHKKK